MNFLFDIVSLANLNIYLFCCIHDLVLYFYSWNFDDIVLGVIPQVKLNDGRLFSAMDLFHDNNC